MQSTTTAVGNSWIYRLDTPDRTFQQDIYIAVAAELAGKWPTRQVEDYDLIAAVSCELTKRLVEQYNRNFNIEEL